MSIPFTHEQFFDVFIRYNETVWPFQTVLLAAALASFFILLRRQSPSGRLVAGILAVLWLWSGIVYQWIFFSPINPAAYAFGALFVLQAMLFTYFGIVRNRFTFSVGRDAGSLLGLSFIIYGTAVYPLLGHMLGHTYPASPTFGAPCPTTIFTLGVLLLARTSVPAWMFIIPGLWTLIGFNAAISFTVYEDYGLLVSAIVSITYTLIIRRRRPVLKN